MGAVSQGRLGQLPLREEGLLDALGIIRKRAHDLVVVVDDERRPMGIVTHADLRERDRYTPVAQLMNSRLVTMPAGTSNRDAFLLMEEARVKAAFCLRALGRETEAADFFERVAAEEGEHWPIVAGAELLMIRVRQRRYAELHEEKREAEVMREVETLSERTADPSLCAAVAGIKAFDLLQNGDVEAARPHVAEGMRLMKTANRLLPVAGFECYRADAMLARRNPVFPSLLDLSLRDRRTTP